MRVLPRFSWRSRNPLRSINLSPLRSYSSQHHHPPNCAREMRNKRDQIQNSVLRGLKTWKALVDNPRIRMCRRVLVYVVFRLGCGFLPLWAITGLLEYPFSHEDRVQAYLKKLEATRRDSEDDSTVYGDLGVDQFRLFILEPGLDNEIRGRFVVEKIGQPLAPYEALSYHWGSTEKTAMIHCHHHEIPITASLHDALRELRLPYADRVLWIDALCINQADVEERNKQVRRMREIYQNAYRVMIWLGKETEDVEGVFKLLKFIRESSNHQKRPLWYPIYSYHGLLRADMSYIWYDRITAYRTSNKAERECWGLMNTLLCRPWFHRVWVLQEIVHAQRATVFMSRNTEMDWDDFAIVVSRAHSMSEADSKISESAVTALRTVLEIQRARRQNLYGDFLHEAENKREFLQMLLMASSSACTDDRDKIYAVLTLANDLDASDLEGPLAPDYGHEITPEDVYRRFAVWCILGTKNLGLLSCATNAANRSLPSWIPDWRNVSSEYTFVRFSDRIPFPAGLPTLFTFGIKPNPEISDDYLLLSAKRVDSIQIVGYADSRVEGYLDRNPIAARIFNGQVLQYLSQIGVRADPQYKERFLDNVVAGKEIPNLDFYRYMVCCLTEKGSRASTMYIARLRIFYRYLMQNLNIPIPDENEWWITKYFREELIDGSPENSWKFDTILGRFEKWTAHRTMGLTDAGRMCWLPPEAKKGDLVYIVPGCQVPYVFRMVDGGKHTLVGEAYIHGIMFGEETPKTRRELERLTLV